ncbi:MAG: F0F1 ATP synthase subunit B [Candidatus Krumholzibacteriota bacterium]|nr:F0F1 ATP synthase subunit B [Candidatus Krumholzibacteriota bacterium]
MNQLMTSGAPVLLAAAEHAEAAGRKFGLLTPDPGLIFWTVVTFLGLLWLLRKTAWGPILDGLERREETIRRSLADAERASEEARRTIAEQQAALAEARDEAQRIIERGTGAAKAAQEDILARARTEAGELVEAARREIRLETERVRDELRSEVVDLSLTVAGKLLERSLGDEDHRRLADEFLREVGKTQ